MVPLVRRHDWIGSPLPNLFAAVTPCCCTSLPDETEKALHYLTYGTTCCEKVSS
jgi:hypothetical protein